MSTIIIMPVAGLGNRIRTIASAYGLARQCNKTLKVIWIKEKGLPCPAGDLFSKPDDFDIIDYNSTKSFLADSATRALGVLHIKKAGGYLIFNDLSKFTGEAALKETDNLFIKSCHRFYKYPHIPLQFGPAVQQTGDRFLGPRDAFIGIHIRRGDNVLAIKHSPLQLFMDKASEEIENKRSVFLCTDDADIKKAFRDKFGDAVFTRDAVLNRNSPQGIVDAAVDMYCLSKAQKLYASVNSSFSTISAEFNNTPIERLRHEEG